MKVCIASTYPPSPCGIGTYTRQLALELAKRRDLEVTILAERGPASELGEPGVAVVRAYHRDCDWVAELSKAAIEAQADLVHVQHAPDLFGCDQKLPQLARTLASNGIRSVVTLHTVHTRSSAAMERRRNPASFYRELGQSTDAIVVHQAEVALRELGARIDSERLHVIAHGTPAPDLPERKESRSALGLPEDQPFVVCVGFVHIQKNFHTVIRAAALARTRLPRLRLMLVGSMLNRTWFNRGYFAWLRRLARDAGGPGAVDVEERYVTDQEMLSLYRAADLALFPYWEGYASASGMLHSAIAAHTPMLCSRSPKFAEAAELLGQEVRIGTFSVDGWSNAMTKLLENPSRLADMRQALRRYAEQTSWARVAAQTHELYEALVARSG